MSILFVLQLQFVVDIQDRCQMDITSDEPYPLRITEVDNILVSQM